MISISFSVTVLWKEITEHVLGVGPILLQSQLKERPGSVSSAFASAKALSIGTLHLTEGEHLDDPRAEIAGLPRDLLDSLSWGKQMYLCCNQARECQQAVEEVAAGTAV
jgi:hypothetical protein